MLQEQWGKARKIYREDVKYFHISGKRKIRDVYCHEVEKKEKKNSGSEKKILQARMICEEAREKSTFIPRKPFLHSFRTIAQFEKRKKKLRVFFYK